jgi:hypothetical protein
MTASAIAQQRDNQRLNHRTNSQERRRIWLVALAAHERGDRMEPYFMALAILFLTLIASYAIRRAEEEMIERHDLDRRMQSGPSSSSRQIDEQTADGTKVRA